MNVTERDAIIGRVRRKLDYSTNRSTYLKISGFELAALYDKIDGGTREVDQVRTESAALVDAANERADAAEEREAVAVRRQAEAEGLAADALADKVNVPKAARGRKPTAPKVDPVYPAVIRAANDVNTDLSELWGKPLVEALHGWEDYNGPLPDGWETIVEKSIADAPTAADRA